ncbi:tetratricopeptide repeat protein [Ectopseudomonas mendocina]|uniref:Tetratricopeptide repeat protein n=1 Tax=Ectopseudomonas mendocina TaxID=300 RepID=A0ABZ2RDP0_ECTME
MKKASSKRGSINKQQLALESFEKRARRAYSEGHHQLALEACLGATQINPRLAPAWIDAAVNCIKLERWESAIEYANRALNLGAKSLALFDALSHAHGALKQWDQVRAFGLKALTLRNEMFSAPAPLPAPEVTVLPAPPSNQSRGRNLIAFSLFGRDSKYCETAIINAQEQPTIYPNWTCRFYIDDSVPANIVQRLRNAGAQVRYVDEQARHWPGPMWRFLALSEPNLDRVLFRDADSVISQREAQAVELWVSSGKRFHAMRDSASHTELLLAGLWGCVAGALPNLDELLELFAQQPMTSTHFADQYFLRQLVWPYARESLLQHDSVFGFLDAPPFPDGPAPADFHVGYAEGSPFFSLPTALPEGTHVEWHFYRLDKVGTDTQRKRLCSYPATVSNGQVRAHLPARYAHLIESGSGDIRLKARQE